jgi:hypothetical protein
LIKFKTHHVTEPYDKQADVENLVGKAKREGLGAVPDDFRKPEQDELDSIASNTIPIARLKLLFIAATVVKDQKQNYQGGAGQR